MRKKDQIGVNMRVVALVFVLAQLLLMCGIASGCALMDMGIYNKAERLYAEGNYAEAAETYAKIPDYSDAAEKRTLCENHIKYAEADGSFAGGNYAAAAEQFGALGDFEDSAARAAQSRAAVDDAAWAKAAAADTEAAYGGYLTEWPDGAHRDESAAAMENLAWTAASAEDTEAAYQEYLERYPDGAHGGDARAGLEKLAWDVASASGDIPAYEAYLEEYADGAFADDAKDRIGRLHDTAHDMAYDVAASEDTVTALLAFLDEWPDTERRTEAERRVAALKADTALSAPLLSDPQNADAKSVDAFLAAYPGHVDEAAVRALLTQNDGTIADLAERGVLDMAITGQSITDTKISVTNNSSFDARVEIPLGTYFAANSGSVQNMVVREATTLSVGAGETASVTVPTACMNIRRSIPGSEDSFEASSLGDDARLTRLMRVLEENGCDYAVTQAAVWIVTDNPGDTALTDTLVYSDGSHAIGADDLATAKEMVNLVG